MARPSVFAMFRLFDSIHSIRLFIRQRSISFLMRHRDAPPGAQIFVRLARRFAVLVHLTLTHLSHHVEHQRRHGQRGPLGPLVGGLLPPSAQGSYRGTLTFLLCGAHRNESTTEATERRAGRRTNKCSWSFALVVCVESWYKTAFPAGIFRWIFGLVGYGAGTKRNRARSPINQLEVSPCSMHHESNAFHARLIQLSESM